ncbi:MAG: hypothetical protein MUP30_09270 [Deltaproteobacteria bacterium]|nr:hypothetical protein [Deltaproteobacteria bacterium]
MDIIKRWATLMIVVTAFAMLGSNVLAANTENCQNYRPWYEFPIYLAVLLLVAFLGPYIQAKKTRRMRMDEVLAEKKIVADGEAYARMKDIQSMLIQLTLQDVKKEMSKEERWFFKNLLFLPGKFPDMWLTIRNNVDQSIRLEKKMIKARDTEFEKLSKETDEKFKFVTKLAEDALLEIYKDIKTRSKLKLIPFKEWQKKSQRRR